MTSLFRRKIIIHCKGKGIMNFGTTISHQMINVQNRPEITNLLRTTTFYRSVEMLIQRGMF